MGMAQPQDAFAAWLQAFAQDNDLLLSDDDDQLAAPGQQCQDTQLLIAQLQQVPAPAELLPELDMEAGMDFVDAMPQHSLRPASVHMQQLDQQHDASHGGSSSSKQDSKGTQLRLKNTKRYKSQAQKDAHKRYRERKKQSITTMEQDVEAKQRLLQQLQAENAALHSKMRVLETSLNCSTQIHGLMQLIEGVDRLGISSSSSSREDSGTTGSSSCSSRSTSKVAAAAAVAGLVAPSMPGLDAGLLRSIGSIGSGNSSADAAVGGLDATGSSGNLEQQQPQLWLKQEQSPVQPWASQQQQQQMADACQLQQLHSAAQPSDSSSVPASMVVGSDAVAGDASSRLQAIFADAQQQQRQQQALSLAASGVAAGAARAVVDVAPLSGHISSPEQGVLLYKEFLGKAQVLMLQRSCNDPGIAAAADAQLAGLTRSAISEVFQPFLVARGQGVVYDMATRRLDTLQPAEPPEQLWPAVLQAMALNQQQQQDALACFSMFGACLSRLVDQRLALNAQYKALQQAEEAADRVSKVLLRAHSLEVLQAISKSLAAYGSLDGVFAHSVTSIISGSQMAVACVTSYPWLPDWHKIMAALQLQDEAAQAAAADAAGAQQAPRKQTRRGRPPRSTQPLGVQHAVRA